MSNSPNRVTLTVNSDDTYVFSGGNQGNGNVTYSVGGGQAAITIDLVAPRGYSIASIDFDGTGVDNVRYNITQNGGGAVIIDTCNTPATVDYTVNVTTSGGGSIPCHPRIVNQ